MCSQNARGRPVAAVQLGEGRDTPAAPGFWERCRASAVGGRSARVDDPDPSIAAAGARVQYAFCDDASSVRAWLPNYATLYLVPATSAFAVRASN